MTGARVTVGMPVFNGGEGFARALAAIRSQTLRELEIVVSDNGSTDDTPEIIAAAVREDPRVRAIVQDPAVPAWSNFRAVLDAADTELFMWSAADDVAPPELAERACALLDARPDIVAAIPEVRFVDDAGRMRPAQGGFELLGTSRENARDFLAAPIDNSRFYGVFRRDALARAMPTEDFYGVDLAVSLATLRDGGQALLPGVVLVRGDSPDTKYLDLVDRYYGESPWRYAAFAPFAWHVVRELRPLLSPAALAHLLRLTAWSHVAYTRLRHPAYGRVAYALAGLAERARLRVAGPPRT